MEIRPGLYLVAEVPPEIGPEFGAGPLLAPLMVASAVSALTRRRRDEDGERTRPSVLSAWMQRLKSNRQRKRKRCRCPPAPASAEPVIGWYSERDLQSVLEAT